MTEDMINTFTNCLKKDYTQYLEDKRSRFEHFYKFFEIVLNVKSFQIDREETKTIFTDGLNFTHLNCVFLAIIQSLLVFSFYVHINKRTHLSYCCFRNVYLINAVKVQK